jgi:enterobactin synthetase component D
MTHTPFVAFLLHPKIGDVGLEHVLYRQVAMTKKSVPLHAHLVEFLPNSFTSGAFDRAGIACPASIQRSAYKRQMEFFFGRLAARQALSELGLSGGQVPMGAQRQPVWPHGVIGSITHTNGVAAAVATRLGVCRGIGIDAEKVMDPSTCQAVIQTVVGEQELEYLHSLSDISLQMALTIVFSAKESFYKAAYATVGRFFDFSAVRVTKMDARKQRLTLVLNETLSDHFCRGAVWEAQFTFVRRDTVLTCVVW